MATKKGPSTNGHTALVPDAVTIGDLVPGPIFIRRYDWIDLPEYPGFRIRMWQNPTGAVIQRVLGGTPEQRLHGMKAIFIEHNGWRVPVEDENGEPIMGEDGTPEMRDLPQPTEEGFWTDNALPNEVGPILGQLVMQAAKILPNSPPMTSTS